MSKEEALGKLEEIGNVIRSSNRFIFSGGATIGYGIGFLILFVINFMITKLSLVIVLSNYVDPKLIYAVFSLFGFLVVYFFGFIVNKVYPTKCLAVPHPIIVRAFSIWKPLMVSIVGVAYLLSTGGYTDIVFPICLLLMGVGYNLIGRFSLYVIERVSWLYIIVALFIIMIGEKNLFVSSQHIFFVLSGVTYIYMGIALNRQFKDD